MVKRTPMGRLAFLTVAIDAGYTYLDSEKSEYERYDGGQGEFHNTELFKIEMKVIEEMESELKSIISPWT